MGVDRAEISKTILELEKSFNERWSVGDNRGYFDNYTEEVSYFDPIVKELVVGRDNVIAHIDPIYGREVLQQLCPHPVDRRDHDGLRRTANHRSQTSR
ncbi:MULTISPECIES: hypothetical protein [unclassified Streptomyces]|uniref:Uncharacterized protein n=1 Tax=Streptomyces sp. NBC_00119 TaxID=2975659 RepID=A0AAU1ULG2_9ACTN|nr:MULTISPECIES: hypothetical protein [unclassified Streptomyces]MCX4649564.1 hypothetical protein [Streptomyces sp. NBC_01446]MCX5321230.1 hypothetical protein [Streptomyces sp. NBC_00120]